jgi:hypothetical protein
LWFTCSGWAQLHLSAAAARRHCNRSATTDIPSRFECSGTFLPSRSRSERRGGRLRREGGCSASIRTRERGSEVKREEQEKNKRRTEVRPLPSPSSTSSHNLTAQRLTFAPVPDDPHICGSRPLFQLYCQVRTSDAASSVPSSLVSPDPPCHVSDSSAPS